MVVLSCLSLGSIAGLVGGMVSCAPEKQAVQARPLSASEASRLGDMRVTNYRDERAGIHATWGDGAAQVRVAGWIDWKKSLAYVRVGGPGAGDRRGLLQAVPGVLATRSATPGEAAEEADPAQSTDATKPAPPVAEPPATPPADGWQIRPWSASGKTAKPLDAFLSLMFVMASTKPDPADLLARTESRWMGQERIGGTTVDVLLGPAVPPQPLPTVTPPAPAKPKSTPSSTAAEPTTDGPTATEPSATEPAGDETTRQPERAKASASASPGMTAASPSPSRTAPPTALNELGGTVRYWLDSGAKLRRFEALLPGNLSVRADLDRENRPELTAVAAFGGAPITPRAPSKTEAALLAKMRQRNLERGGARLTIDVPTLPVADLRGGGWLDWNSTVAYLAVADTAKPTDVAFLRASVGGVAYQTRTGKAMDTPPLPAPDSGWQFQAWAQRTDARGSLDIDLLLGEALASAATTRDSASYFVDHASFLRKDKIDGVGVTVFEIAKPAEQGIIGRGQARMRYWLDKTGAVRRLEARTRSGTWAQLNLTDDTIPTLPTAPLG
ncbi:hypothetical protein AB0J74_00575 [Asanoa sp. NPDC049573]|uniref:hypothetical protein n=1 Tax=Asanoa sp. NPDC049573 TaxID=3155396 RepID=UPI00342E5892